MSRLLLLGSSALALTVAASFFGAAPAMAQCTPSSGTLPGVSSGVTITCAGTVNQTTAIANNSAANNVSVVLQSAASVSVVTSATPPVAFVLGNNASLTLNSGALLADEEGPGGMIGPSIKKTAFQSGNSLQALIMSGAEIDGEVTAGANSHITVAGTLDGFGDAVLLTGDGNTITLDPSFSIIGDIVAGDVGATNTTLELGGSGTGTLSTALLGSDYTNFAKFLKSGDSTWILTGVPTQTVTPWTITGGTLAIDSDAELGDNTSTLTLNGGTLDVTAVTAGSRPIVLGGGSITVESAATYTYSGTFSGTGPLGVNGAGSLILTGPQSVAGVSGAGNLVLAGTLTSNQSANTVFSGVISGAGPLVKSGSGTLTLNGINSYTGGTTASAGTLAGTGTIGELHVTTGTVSPGTGSGSGSLHTGNLTLASGATTLINIAPAGSASLLVTGTASINGTLVANGTGGSYAVGTKYTVLTSTGALSGTYASVSATNLSAALRPVASYDAHDVYITLAANALTPLLPSGATRNELALAGAIDAAIKNGATPSTAFSAVFNASGAGLETALDQLTGEISGDAALAAEQSFDPFLALMTDSDGGSGNVNTASNAPANVHPAQASFGPLNLWTAAYGGYSNFGLSTISGAQPLNTKAFGGVVGVDHDFDGVLLGASAAAGQNNFALTANQSAGTSTDLMFGLYGRTALLDAGYITGAIAYGSHNVVTERVVTVGTTSVLRGHFSADDFGGRAEAGYNFSLDDGHILTPYAAIAGNSISVPAYSETAESGASTFALAYAAKNDGLLHSELGARISHDWVMDTTKLTAELHGAWAHQFVQDTGTVAAFQNLTGSGFAAAGNLIPRETADIGAGLQVSGDSGFHGGARVESQLGSGFTAVSGMVDFGYRW